MSAFEILKHLRQLPLQDRVEVIGQALGSERPEDAEAIVRRSRAQAFREMCALLDNADHAGKHLSEEDIIAMSLREKRPVR